MLIAEVKDGRYEVSGRTWYAVRQGGAVPLDRSPFDQATNNRYKLARWLKETTGVSVPGGHCVVFADGRPSGSLGPEAPGAITLTGAQLGNARQAIHELVEHWFSARPWACSNEDFKRVFDALVPTATVAPALDYDIDVAAAELEELTERQVKLTQEQLAVLCSTSSHRNSLVLGAAGTGKTVLALYRAHALTRSGLRGAVVCEQKHLRFQVRSRLQLSHVVAGTPSEVLHDAFRESEEQFSAQEEFWELTLRLVLEHGAPFDYLIVDEAQCYDDTVVEALTELVVPEGSITLFADPYQRDASGTWRPHGEFNEFWLTQNCRNTLPIARLVSRISGALPPAGGAKGRSPRFVGVDSAPASLAAAASEAAATSEVLAPGAVVVLCRSTECDSVRAELKRRGIPVTGMLGDEALLVCSVEDFRGCESPAVIYLADGALGPDRTLDYVAVSRACAYLVVVGRQEEWGSLRYLFEEER